MGGDRRLFVAEDDFGQVEVVPAAVIEWCLHQFDAIAAFSARHAAPGGGWNDIYVRPPAPSRLADLAIAYAVAVAAIQSHLPPFDEVVSGSWVEPRPIRRAQAFGASPLAAVVLIADAAEQALTSVDVILRCGGLEAAAVLGALGSLPSPEPLLIVDWDWARCVRLANAKEVEVYLRDLAG